MSEQQRPRPKDRVRVIFDADFVSQVENNVVVDVADGMGPIHIEVPAWATVEVLERADDPSQALAGSVRKDPKFDKPDRIVVAVAASRSDDARWRSVNGNYYLVDEEVVGWDRLTPVAGSPAAEAERVAVEHTDLFEPEPDVIPAASLFPPPVGTAAPREAQKLLVHPHVWKSLDAWLNSRRIKLVPTSSQGDQTPMYRMELMDGEWPGE